MISGKGFQCGGKAHFLEKFDKFQKRSKKCMFIFRICTKALTDENFICLSPRRQSRKATGLLKNGVLKWDALGCLAFIGNNPVLGKFGFLPIFALMISAIFQK
jgi:hypothetical protein